MRREECQRSQRERIAGAHGPSQTPTPSNRAHSSRILSRRGFAAKRRVARSASVHPACRNLRLAVRARDLGGRPERPDAEDVGAADLHRSDLPNRRAERARSHRLARSPHARRTRQSGRGEHASRAEPVLVVGRRAADLAEHALEQLPASSPSALFEMCLGHQRGERSGDGAAHALIDRAQPPSRPARRAVERSSPVARLQSSSSSPTISTSSRSPSTASPTSGQ